MYKQLKKILSREPKSKNVAKDRLKLILIQDQLGLNEEVMRDLQRELTLLLSEYFELAPNNIDVGIQRDEQSMALVANIPVSGLKARRPVQYEASSPGTSSPQ